MIDSDVFDALLREADWDTNKDQILLAVYYLDERVTDENASKEKIRELLKNSKTPLTPDHLAVYLSRLEGASLIKDTDDDYRITIEGEGYLTDELGIDWKSDFGDSQQSRFELDGEAFRNDLLEVSLGHYERGDFDDAVRNAFILLEQRIKEEGDFDQETTGSDLATEAFKPGGPLTFGETNSEEEGVMYLYKGAFMSLRNPASHRFLDNLGPKEAHSMLSLANLLLMWLEDNAIESSD